MNNSAADPSGNLFELDDVTVRYPSVAALADVSLRIRDGECVALVGPSGSGKTTLLRLLNATVRPTTGRVRVRGQQTGELTAGNLRRLRSRIGFVHQHLGLVPNLRVLQNVITGRMGRTSFFGSVRMMLLPSMKEIAEIHELLEQVGIEEKLYQRTDRLSGGQQQRVAIARALYQQPEAILADEPVSSVDPARASDTVRLLTEISRAAGLTLCMSLHNIDVAREFFPRLIGLRHGRVVFDRATEDLDDAEFKDLYRLTKEEMLSDESK